MTINDLSLNETFVTPAGMLAKLVRKGKTISQIQIVDDGETYAVWNTMEIQSAEREKV